MATHENDDLFSSALMAAQRHADRFGVSIPLFMITPSKSKGSVPATSPPVHASLVPAPTTPVHVLPPPSIRLDAPRDMPNRKVARARPPKKGGQKIKHEVDGRNVKEFLFSYNGKDFTLTLADVSTPQGMKTSAYIGKGYVCDFAQTPEGAACILRHPNRGKRIETSEPIPAEYQDSYCVDYRTFTGYAGSGVPDSVWCVVVPPGDYTSIAAVAIRRWLAAR